MSVENVIAVGLAPAEEAPVGASLALGGYGAAMDFGRAYQLFRHGGCRSRRARLAWSVQPGSSSQRKAFVALIVRWIGVNVVVGVLDGLFFQLVGQLQHIFCVVLLVVRFIFHVFVFRGRRLPSHRRRRSRPGVCTANRDRMLGQSHTLG